MDKDRQFVRFSLPFPKLPGRALKGSDVFLSRVATAIPAPGDAIMAMLGMPLIGWARRRSA